MIYLIIIILLWIVLALVFLALVLFGIYITQLYRTNGKLVVGGEKRRYLLYVPKIYDPAKPTPLIISIHGYAEWPAHQRDISGWNKLADRDGLIVVYPAGTGFPRHWRASGSSDSYLDVDFISVLIDKLSATYNIDSTRIYANGLSNGGGMSFMLSCTLADRIAAIGCVSGAYLFPWDQCQKKERGVPMIAFHGTSDPIVPYNGGPSRSFALPFPAIPKWVAEYAVHNGCTNVPVSLGSIGAVSSVKYLGSARDANVVFYTISGGGHTWPGKGTSLPMKLVGTTNHDIQATELIWAFLQAHPINQ